MFMKKASLFPFNFFAKAVAVGKTTSQIISGERPWRKWARGDSIKFCLFFYIHSNYDDLHWKIFMLFCNSLAEP